MNPKARDKGPNGSGPQGRDEMLTGPRLSRGLECNDLLSEGTPWETQHNPTDRRGGRDDGTRMPSLRDADGFEADDSNVSGTWHDGQNPNRAGAVDRIRPEVNAQNERGYVWNEPSYNPDTVVITDMGGGAIRSA